MATEKEKATAAQLASQAKGTARALAAALDLASDQAQATAHPPGQVKHLETAAALAQECQAQLDQALDQAAATAAEWSAAKAEAAGQENSAGAAPQATPGDDQGAAG